MWIKVANVGKSPTVRRTPPTFPNQSTLSADMTFFRNFGPRISLSPFHFLSQARTVKHPSSPADEMDGGLVVDVQGVSGRNADLDTAEALPPPPASDAVQGESTGGPSLQEKAGPLNSTSGGERPTTAAAPEAETEAKETNVDEGVASAIGHQLAELHAEARGNAEVCTGVMWCGDYFPDFRC